METPKQIAFLPNPHINGNSSPIYKPVKIYANLFEIKLTKELKVYQYPYKLTPKIPQKEQRDNTTKEGLNYKSIT